MNEWMNEMKWNEWMKWIRWQGGSLLDPPFLHLHRNNYTTLFLASLTVVSVLVYASSVHLPFLCHGRVRKGVKTQIPVCGVCLFSLRCFVLSTHIIGGEFKEHQTVCVGSEALTPTNAQVGVTDGGVAGRQHRKPIASALSKQFCMMVQTAITKGFC